MGAGRPQIRCRGLLQEGMEEKHTHPVTLTGTEQGEQLIGDRSRGMQEEREAERERTKHLPAPLGMGEKLGAHWDNPPASPGDSRDMSGREQRARVPPRQAGSASPLQLQPLQSPRQL